MRARVKRPAKKQPAETVEERIIHIKKPSIFTAWKKEIKELSIHEIPLRGNHGMIIGGTGLYRDYSPLIYFIFIVFAVIMAIGIIGLLLLMLSACFY